MTESRDPRIRAAMVELGSASREAPVWEQIEAASAVRPVPVPGAARPRRWAAGARRLIEHRQRLTTGDLVPAVVLGRFDMGKTESRVTGRRGLFIAAAALVAALAIALPLLFLRGGDELPVVATDVTTTLVAGTTTPTTTALTTTTAVPGIAAVSIPAGSTFLGVGDPLVAVSAGEAWAAMGTEGHPAALIGHLKDGAWAYWQLTTEGAVRALAEAPDGTVWAATDLGVFSFDGVEWTRRFDGRATGVTVGEDGTVWITDGLSLVRWDGESWEEVALSPEEMSGGSVDMAVLPGGEVWMTAHSYGCMTSPLMRYDGATLEAVEVTDRPRLASGSSYAWVVEAAPNGDLWVAGFLGPDPGASHVPGELALARFDGVSWTVYDWPLPTPIEGVGCHADMLDMAVAPDGVVWLASPFGFGSFDGTNGTPYIEGDIEGDSGYNWVFKVDVAPDGTVWYKDYQLHTLSTP